MKRYSLMDLIHLDVFGIKEDIDRLQPIEEITSIEYPVDSNRLIIHSENYSQEVFDYMFAPVKRVFKNASIYLSKLMTNKFDEVRHTHVIIFELGRGYYGLLIGIRKEGENE